jgi:hypothetical protein
LLGVEAGIAKAEVSSRVLSSQTHGSQVLRKSIVQTTFKELYEFEVNSFIMKPISEDLIPPEIHSLEDLIIGIKTWGTNCWVVDPETLGRGQLLELEVQLEAETIFRVSAVVSTLLEILQEDPSMFGIDIYDELNQVKSIDRILQRLLVGLVPVRGQVIDFCVVEVEGKEWIIHHKLLDNLPTGEKISSHPLYIVGVAEQSLFWKDIRRVLFSTARFRVLCRIAQDGIQDSWTPVKLADVLELVVPGLASQINTSGEYALDAMGEAKKPNSSTVRKQQYMHRALIIYAQLLADHYGYTITEQNLSEAGLPSELHLTSLISVKERREAFDAIATFVLNRFRIEREPLVVTHYRTVALTDAGLDISGQVTPPQATTGVTSLKCLDERFIDSEFVAIYW